jgi:hypothetical protein
MQLQQHTGTILHMRGAFLPEMLAVFTLHSQVSDTGAIVKDWR